MVLVVAGHQRRDRTGVEDLAEQAGDREDDQRRATVPRISAKLPNSIAPSSTVAASAWSRPTGTKTTAPISSSLGAQPR